MKLSSIIIYCMRKQYSMSSTGQSITGSLYVTPSVFLQTCHHSQHTTQFNEPWTFCYWGYDQGIHAPGHYNEAYQCAHNVLLSHAAAVKYFRSANVSGQIGITLNVEYGEPASESVADYNSSQRYLIWQLAWFADPIWYGDYPQIMKDYIGDRLPSFTDEQKEDLKDSHDFLA